MNKLTKILSIDGGGIRGILPAVLLAGLEEKIQQKTGNKSAHLADYFDFFAGTSTGGLLCFFYLTPDEHDLNKIKYTAKQAPEFYLTYADSAFKPKGQNNTEYSFHKYSPQGLESRAKFLFKDLKISQLIKPCCITAYNPERLEPHLFLSHNTALKPDDDYLIRDVLRATTALPGIYPPAIITSTKGETSTFVDGSIFAHNPAFFAYLHAKKLYPNAQDFMVFSVGTGHVSALSDGLNVYDNSDKNWSRLLSEIAFGNSFGITNIQFEEAFYDKPHSKYIHLQPSLTGLNPAMDDASPSNIQRLYQRGKEFLSENEKLLNEVTDLITASGEN